MSEVVRRLTEDVANIQKLGDNPRTDNGMDAAELKAWFDKAPEAIKSFLNESMIPDIERKFRSQDEWADTVDEAINSFVKGEGFVPLDGSQPMTGDLNMDGHRVVGVADPTDGSHATNKKYVDSVKETANTALAKANAAQPALNFVPVQQGFADGTGGSKIRLGWKQASNGDWTIGVEVDDQYIGDVVVDSAAFGATTPVAKGGTGATTAANARTNLGVPSEEWTMTITPVGEHDCDTIFDAGLTLLRNGKNLPSPEPYGTMLTLPYRYPKGNYQPSLAGQIFLPNGDSATKADTMYFRTSFDKSWRSWREVMTTVLDDHLYGDTFPANAEKGQIFFLKG